MPNAKSIERNRPISYVCAECECRLVEWHGSVPHFVPYEFYQGRKYCIPCAKKITVGLERCPECTEFMAWHEVREDENGKMICLRCYEEK